VPSSHRWHHHHHHQRELQAAASMDHPLRLVPVNAHQGEDRDMAREGATEQFFAFKQKT